MIALQCFPVLRDTVSVNRARAFLSRSGFVPFENISAKFPSDRAKYIPNLSSLKKQNRSIDYISCHSPKLFWKHLIQKLVMLQFIVLEYSRSKDDSKDFQTIPPRQHRREAASCVLLSHLMPASANSKTVVRPLRVEIQDPGIQDAKLERRCIHVQQRPSASRQREGSRFERGPPRRLAPPRYSPSLECNYAFGFDVVAAS